MAKGYYYADEPSWWSRNRGRKSVWAILVAIVVAIVIIIVAVVATVQKQKTSSYPDYTRLNYTLSETYSPSDFWSNFDYFVGWDPSKFPPLPLAGPSRRSSLVLTGVRGSAHGFVHYVPEATALQLNLTSTSASSAVLRADTSVGPSSSPNASTGRFSVRVESKMQYSSGGLFVFDVLHAPYGCGTWPALWLTDPANWPANGEMDVMESLNQATAGNQMTLHTASGCDMSSVQRLMTGAAAQGDCDSAANNNSGCAVAGPAASVGAAFNSAGGGVMALEWRDEGIRMWQFNRSGVPADILSHAPDPSSWGTAAADFPDTNCDIGSHFRNQSIVIDIDFCGDADSEAAYSAAGCPSTCTDYVANNPSAFETAYWEFASFKIYTAS